MGGILSPISNFSSTPLGVLGKSDKKRGVAQDLVLSWENNLQLYAVIRYGLHSDVLSFLRQKLRRVRKQDPLSKDITTVSRLYIE